MDNDLVQEFFYIMQALVSLYVYKIEDDVYVTMTFSGKRVHFAEKYIFKKSRLKKHTRKTKKLICDPVMDIFIF